MKNHPHDSICGCSVDEVHREMVTRFESVIHMGEVFVKEQAAELAAAVDTSKTPDGRNSIDRYKYNGMEQKRGCHENG